MCPVTGLPGKIKWLPTVAEVKAECYAHGHELAKRRRFENWGKQRAAPDSGSAKAIEAERPAREELEQKFGKNFGLDGEPSKKKPTKCTMTPEQLTEYYMKFRLGRQKKEDGLSD